MILVIDNKKQNASTFSEIFHFMGILSRAVTPSSALSEICPAYRALVICRPEAISDVRDFVKRLRSYSVTVPIFALTDSDKFPAEIFDGVYPMGINSSTLVRKIIDFCNDSSLPVVGSYRLAGIEASVDMTTVLYKNEEIPLTRTEKMILRYLIRSYPCQSSTLMILKHAFRESRSPLPSSIRTHVHQINKKLSVLLGAPKIEATDGGYVISTPALAELLTV